MCESVSMLLKHSAISTTFTSEPPEMDYMCFFLLKNYSMTHKTINLYDIYYFQPPKLIKNTFLPLFKNLMLPNKT